jgi:hypothetical protein
VLSRLKDNELGLAKMRKQLEDMFRSLDLVPDGISVASKAAHSEGHPEIANVLSLGVCNRLLSQLKSLTNIIERLGGRTDLSEEQEFRWGSHEKRPQPAMSGSDRHAGWLPGRAQVAAEWRRDPVN